ncbi:hypothetical protein B0J11DRAFT_584973 [Dendryphion nanum]|uniref:Uncharacterized protein n=1 Tax=Dendryphion nanum TaxID=256645 RepID=A0A9P9IBS8_9PLEO|nr:hypothetical protein B0J11DRAFT_584973 [Dendryphion nanum]
MQPSFLLALLPLLPLATAIPSDIELMKKARNRPFSIDGTSHSQLSHSKTLKVTYDNKVICPEARHECGASGSCNFTWKCIDGWSFKALNSKIAGPWKIEITPPKNVIPVWTQFPTEIKMGAIDCDAWNCGGEFNVIFV